MALSCAWKALTLGYSHSFHQWSYSPESPVSSYTTCFFLKIQVIRLVTSCRLVNCCAFIFSSGVREESFEASTNTYLLSTRRDIRDALGRQQQRCENLGSIIFLTFLCCYRFGLISLSLSVVMSSQIIFVESCKFAQKWLDTLMLVTRFFFGSVCL